MSYRINQPFAPELVAGPEQMQQILGATSRNTSVSPTLSAVPLPVATNNPHLSMVDSHSRDSVTATTNTDGHRVPHATNNARLSMADSHSRDSVTATPNTDGQRVPHSGFLPINAGLHSRRHSPYVSDQVRPGVASAPPHQPMSSGSLNPQSANSSSASVESRAFQVAQAAYNYYVAMQNSRAHGVQPAGNDIFQFQAGPIGNEVAKKRARQPGGSPIPRPVVWCPARNNYHNYRRRQRDRLAIPYNTNSYRVECRTLVNTDGSGLYECLQKLPNELQNMIWELVFSTMAAEVDSTKFYVPVPEMVTLFRAHTNTPEGQLYLQVRKQWYAAFYVTFGRGRDAGELSEEALKDIKNLVVEFKTKMISRQRTLSPDPSGSDEQELRILKARNINNLILDFSHWSRYITPPTLEYGRIVEKWLSHFKQIRHLTIRFPTTYRVLATGRYRNGIRHDLSVHNHGLGEVERHLGAHIGGSKEKEFIVFQAKSPKSPLSFLEW